MTLKQWRKYKGYGKREAALALGISLPTLYRIEKNGYGGAGPSGHTIAMIHYITNGMVSIEDLCDEQHYREQFKQEFAKRKERYDNYNSYTNEYMKNVYLPKKKGKKQKG